MIGRLNHIAIAVPDLAKAAKLYATVMGAKVSPPKAQPAHGVTVVFVELPNTKIELLHPLGEKSPTVRFAARSASFVQSFSKLGLVPDSGGTYFLPRLVGSARAMGLALLAERLSADEAERWGLIWKAVDDDRLVEEATSIARALAAGPTKGYGLIKKALHASAGNSLDAQLDLERDLQRDAGFSEDYREGVAAFMQKRRPQYKGK